MGPVSLGCVVLVSLYTPHDADSPKPFKAGPPSCLMRPMRVYKAGEVYRISILKLVSLSNPLPKRSIYAQMHA